jgi:hypothetical protein
MGTKRVSLLGLPCSPSVGAKRAVAATDWVQTAPTAYGSGGGSVEVGINVHEPVAIGHD